MSVRTNTLASRTGKLLLALYPEPWRERYGEEMSALLEDDPPGARGLASLIGGAAHAHARPQRSWRAELAPAAAMRLSVGALFACWMLMTLAGICFVKETEGLSPVEDAQKLLEASHVAIGAGATLGAVAIAIGGLPLLWQALVAAVRRRDRTLALVLASPALAVALFAAFSAFLLFLSPSRAGGFPAAFVAAIVVPWTLAGGLCALVCALAPKAAMRRVQPAVGSLRLASWAGQALTGAMCVICAGLLLYVPELWSVSTAIGAEASGPFGASTRATLCFAPAAALLACAGALIAARRARHAALTAA